MNVSDFLQSHFRHFNARELLAAAKAWKRHVNLGGKMLLTMAGAMSTAEIGRSLAELIRAGYVHAISCTGANLEEDVFNLISHQSYRSVENYRELSASDEAELLQSGFNRVTDTCIPESVMRDIDARMLVYWQEAEQDADAHSHTYYVEQLFADGTLAELAQIPLSDSWVCAAFEYAVPIFTPGWEDSTLGNTFTARCAEKRISHEVVESGTRQMERLMGWYRHNSASPIGFFQIGGGIAGDFAICAVPTLIQDMRISVPLWSYFCQITDCTESYGSYSGANPTEKITWSKIGTDCPRFSINSDATIVAPLIFAYLLNW